MGQSFRQRMTKGPRLDQQRSVAPHASSAAHSKKRMKMKPTVQKQKYQDPIFRAVKYIKDRPWTSYDLSHEFFATYRTLPQSQPRTRQLLQALTTKMIECPHHLKTEDISAIMYSIDKSQLMCPTFADFLSTFGKSLRDTPDRFSPKAAFHSLYFLRNKIHQYNHFIHGVEIGTSLLEDDCTYLQTFDKFVESIAMKVGDSKLGPTFQVSCQFIHQILHPTYSVATVENHKSCRSTISPTTQQNLISASYKCFRIDKHLLSSIGISLHEHLSSPENENLSELLCYSSNDELNSCRDTIRLLQAIWKLPNTDLPHSCVIVNSKDIRVKYGEVTIDPSKIMLKQQMLALLLGGTLKKGIANEININDSIEYDRICVMIYDILELRRFYGRKEDIQDYIHMDLHKDIYRILHDCKELKRKYVINEAQDVNRIFDEMQSDDRGTWVDTNHMIKKTLNYLDLKNILGDPVQREEPEFYMRGLFLR